MNNESNNLDYLSEKNKDIKKDVNNAAYAACLIFTGWALAIFLVVFFNMLNGEKKATVLSNEKIRSQAASSPCIRLKMISTLDNTSQPLTEKSLLDIKQICAETKNGSLPEQWTERARVQLEILTAPTQAAPQ